MNKPSPKNGFDLIDYPCEFTFKAMCRLEAGDKQQVLDDLHKATSTVVAKSTIKGVHSKTSRTGKYLSVSLTLELSSKDELESVYTAISDSPSTIMTL